MLVGQGGEHFGLAPEASKVIGSLAMHDFHRDVAVKLLVVSQVDLCHATSLSLPQEDWRVVAELASAM
jgi:hypothetical protein